MTATRKSSLILILGACLGTVLLWKTLHQDRKSPHGCQGTVASGPIVLCDGDGLIAPLSPKSGAIRQGTGSPREEVGRPASLRGMVRWRGSCGVADAMIELRIGDWRTETRSTATGEYAIQQCPTGNATFTAFAGLGNLWGLSMARIAPGDNVLDVEIDAEATLDITVTDESGGPLPARVSIMDPFIFVAHRPASLPRGSSEHLCDVTGRVRIEHLLPMSQARPFRSARTAIDGYSIWINHPGYRPTHTFVGLVSGPNILRVALQRLPPDITVSGRVYAPDGRPARATRVQWEYVRGTSRKGPVTRVESTGESGDFLFSIPSMAIVFDAQGRLDGELYVRCEREGCAETYVKLEDVCEGAAISNVLVQLLDGDRVCGRVVTEMGQPVPAATVSIVRLQDGLERGGTEVLTDDTGGFHIFLPKTGRYRFWASKDGFTGQIREGEDSEIRIVDLPTTYVELVLVPIK